MTVSSKTFVWQGQSDFVGLIRSPSIEVYPSGPQLYRRLVLADESGNCNGRDVQPIDGRTWARKDFWLEPGQAVTGRLSPWVDCENPDATLLIEINGHPQSVHPNLAPVVPPESSMADKLQGYWQNHWRTVPVEAGWLMPGLNTVILRTEDGSRWNTLIEVSRYPNRSACSLDGGQTWDDEHLGYNQCYDGEYLVRLELDCYPKKGELISDPIDLAVTQDGLGQPGIAQQVRLEAICEALPGTSLSFEFRTGPTPSYDPADWSAWQAGQLFELRPDDRFGQWRALFQTQQPSNSPVLKSVRLVVSGEFAEAGWGRLMAASNPPILRPSYPFGYQAPSLPTDPMHSRQVLSRPEILRQRWHLDQVIAGAQNDFEAADLLAHWTRQQWTDGWNRQWGQLQFTLPWDAPLILELASQHLTYGMCTHYSTVLVEACAALGIPARHMIMRAHCTAEIWTDYYGKWVWFDHSGDLSDETMAVYHLEKDGLPLSALEVRTAWLSGQADQLRMVGRNADKAFRIEDRLVLLDRIFIPNRNDYLTSLNPGEPEHGAISYQYDGYLWWRDDQTPPLPWFSWSSSREADFYWTPNRTRLHLQRTASPGQVRVLLETSMPNWQAYHIQVDEKGWQESSADFLWTLHPGTNTLAARSTNTFGVQGPFCQVTLHPEPQP